MYITLTLFQNVFSSRLTIDKDKFILINLNSSVEGILINSRMIQSDGFDKFPYKDTKIWNATRNNMSLEIKRMDVIFLF